MTTPIVHRSGGVTVITLPFLGSWLWVGREWCGWHRHYASALYMARKILRINVRDKGMGLFNSSGGLSDATKMRLMALHIESTTWGRG